jgi:hypothetical protein
MTYLDLPAIYRRAIAEFDIHGWCQGKEVDVDGRMCLYAGLLNAAGLNPDEVDQATAVEKAVLAPVQRHLGRLITRWNDEPGRTLADVKGVLLAVAEQVEIDRLTAEKVPVMCPPARWGYEGVS